MPKENALITQESTEVVLRKATDIMNVTNKILKNSKKALATHPDIMMINGLMWQKEIVEEEMNWDDAMEYAKNLRIGGYDDWRLPTIEELEEVILSYNGINVRLSDDEEWDNIMDKNINNDYYHKCVKEKGFTFDDYWSSTTNTSSTDYAGAVYFYNGGTKNYNKSSSLSVRCVRG